MHGAVAIFTICRNMQRFYIVSRRVFMFIVCFSPQIPIISRTTNTDSLYNWPGLSFPLCRKWSLVHKLDERQTSYRWSCTDLQVTNDQIASIIQAAEKCYVLQDSVFCTISPVTRRLTTSNSLRNNNNFVCVWGSSNLLISTHSGLQWSQSLILLNHTLSFGPYFGSDMVGLWTWPLISRTCFQNILMLPLVLIRRLLHKSYTLLFNISIRLIC